MAPTVASRRQLRGSADQSRPFQLATDPTIIRHSFIFSQLPYSKSISANSPQCGVVNRHVSRPRRQLLHLAIEYWPRRVVVGEGQPQRVVRVDAPCRLSASDCSRRHTRFEFQYQGGSHLRDLPVEALVILNMPVLHEAAVHDAHDVGGAVVEPLPASVDT